MTDNREYRIAMNSLDAINLMGIIDAASSELEDGEMRDRLSSIVAQIDKEHTRFLTDTVGSKHIGE